MAKSQLTKDSNFVVTESRTLNLGVGIFFFILTVLSLLVNPHTLTYARNAYLKSVFIVLIPAIFFTLKGVLQKNIFNINASGIYQYGNSVTDWSNFSSAYIKQDEIAGDIKDNFVLNIEYFNPDEEAYHLRRIPLTDTQTKSEEEILEAINFFVELYKNENVLS